MVFHGPRVRFHVGWDGILMEVHQTWARIQIDEIAVVGREREREKERVHLNQIVAPKPEGGIQNLAGFGGGGLQKRGEVSRGPAALLMRGPQVPV